jgi:hypothetical protein
MLSAPPAFSQGATQMDFFRSSSGRLAVQIWLSRTCYTHEKSSRTRYTAAEKIRQAPRNLLDFSRKMKLGHCCEHFSISTRTTRRVVYFHLVFRVVCQDRSATGDVRHTFLSTPGSRDAHLNRRNMCMCTSLRLFAANLLNPFRII